MGALCVRGAAFQVEINRSLDRYGRIESFTVKDCYNRQLFWYRNDGRIGGVSNEDAVVVYNYSEDGYRLGYILTLFNGCTYAHTLTRDNLRRRMILQADNFSRGTRVSSFQYRYDALGRVVGRNGESFGYSTRGELSDETVGGSLHHYEYDSSGNLLRECLNATTNEFAYNNRNQCVSWVSSSGSVEFGNSVDGCLTSFPPLTMEYDSVNRLESIKSNGVVCVQNRYDPQGRRVIKCGLEVSYFFYDGWCPVLELLPQEDGSTVRFEYYWGIDVSGGLQGAGGVGGLLYVKRGTEIFVPLYDAWGNVTEYGDASGNIVAHYDYDAFGRIVSQSGRLAHLFRHRYATRCFDAEVGLYYYGYRYYSPLLRRWLTQDPCEECGGHNLFRFCDNRPTVVMDDLGLAPSINWGVVQASSGLFAEPLKDFLNGGSSRSYQYRYPDSATTRLLSQHKVAKIWNEFKNIRYQKGRGDYILNRDGGYTARFKDFVGDVSTLLGASVQDGAFDFGVRVLGSFQIWAQIYVRNSKCEKQLKMTISNTFSVESMTRNPITRNPLVTYPFLQPVHMTFNYDITEKLK